MPLRPGVQYYNVSASEKNENEASDSSDDDDDTLKSLLELKSLKKILSVKGKFQNFIPGGVDEDSETDESNDKKIMVTCTII